MKRKIAMLMTTIMLGVTLFGCDDPSNTVNNAGTDQPKEAVTDASTEGDTADAGASATDQNEAGAENSADTASTEDTASNASTEVISVAPEEIVEPEIPQEEVTQPVEETAEAPAEEAAPEEDKNYDIVFMGDSRCMQESLKLFLWHYQTGCHP